MSSTVNATELLPLMDNPEQFYVNVHSQGHPDGAVRGRRGVGCRRAEGEFAELGRICRRDLFGGAVGVEAMEFDLSPSEAGTLTIENAAADDNLRTLVDREDQAAAEIKAALRKTPQ